MTNVERNLAQADYNEFCKIFNGIDFADVERIAKEKGLTFGADHGCELVDINFNTILATCVNKNGKSWVSPDVEIYDKEGNRIYCGELKEKKRRTIKIEVEIEYEYEPGHHALKGMGESYIDAVAKDMAIQPNGNSIVDGVRLIHVCNREEDAWWLING